MKKNKDFTQNVIPRKVVEMAKVIIEADKKKQNVIILQSRQTGKTMAYNLARNNN
jgi:hypothetical protein